MKKDKVSKKESREMLKSQKASVYSAKDRQIAEAQREAARKKEEEAKKREEEARKKEERVVTISVHSSKGKKSQAKAAGEKSLFKLNADGEMLMTSFGKGNEAIQEKRIEGELITDLQQKPAFSAVCEDPGFRISGRQTRNALVENPLHSRKNAGDDLVGMRRELEQMYFGQNFEDNIHIQIIYNILDIDKILAIHINNIVYEINNLFRREGTDYADLIGSLGVGKPYEKFATGESSGTKNLFFLN